MNTSRLTRRNLLHLGAGSLLAAGLWPGSLAAADRDTEEFHFIVVNDMHYRDDQCDPWMTKVFTQMKDHKENIAFCLLVGDVTENGTQNQFGAMRAHFKAFGKPVYPVIGNHDYQVQNDRKPYETIFPERLNYHFTHGGWQFVGLDSTESWLCNGTTVQTDTLTWLEGKLPKLDKKKPTVLFTHFPLGPSMKWRPLNADALLDCFQEFNLRAVYNGHRHEFIEKQMNEVPIATNKCCSWWVNNHGGAQDKGYFLCHAKDGQITRTYVEVK